MEHEVYMREALLEAQKAFCADEVPVGAVVVLDGHIIGRGHNQRETLGDPTAHAEMIALRQAADKNGSWRLNGAVLYVTLEPCPMCAGAMLQSRIERVIYGADDPKGGAAGTVINLLQFPGFNHNVKIVGGVMADQCKEILQKYFSVKRSNR